MKIKMKKTVVLNIMFKRIYTNTYSLTVNNNNNKEKKII